MARTAGCRSVIHTLHRASYAVDGLGERAQRRRAPSRSFRVSPVPSRSLVQVEQQHRGHRVAAEVEEVVVGADRARPRTSRQTSAIAPRWRCRRGGRYRHPARRRTSASIRLVADRAGFVAGQLVHGNQERRAVRRPAASPTGGRAGRRRWPAGRARWRPPQRRLPSPGRGTSPRRPRPGVPAGSSILNPARTVVRSSDLPFLPHPVSDSASRQMPLRLQLLGQFGDAGRLEHRDRVDLHAEQLA